MTIMNAAPESAKNPQHQPESRTTLVIPALAEGEDFEMGPACMLRPGDPGFDECEACQ